MKNIKNYILYLIDKLLKKPNLDNGFIELSEKNIKKQGDFVHDPERFGFVDKDDIFKDIDLNRYRPQGEQQNVGFEKMWCVSESACNTIETDVNCLIDLDKQGKLNNENKEIIKIFRYFGLIKGDRCLLDTNYVAIGSGTTYRGNSQDRVADFIRHYGLRPKGSVSIGETWGENYNRKDGIYINGNKLPLNDIERGKKLVEFIDFSYEWVEPKYFEKSYKYGAIQTSGRMPSPIKEGIYQYTSSSRNHAMQTDKKTNNYYEVFDSYNPFYKKMSLNYGFGWGMLYSFKAKKSLNIFNEKLISELVKEGKKYILLVEDLNNDYTNGAYKIEGGVLQKVTDLKPFIDGGVIKLAESGKLQPRNKQDFKKLFT